MAERALAARSSRRGHPSVTTTLALVLSGPADSVGAPGSTRRYPHLPVCNQEGPPGTCQQHECRYHLAHRGYSEHQLTPTRDCALDVANEGPRTRDQVAAVLGISDERLRQIEKRAFSRLKRNETLRRLHEEAF